MVKFFIKRPVLVGMLITGFCLLGIISYSQLPVELIPFTELPMLIVHVGTARDATPEYLENNAVIKLEGAIASLENIERIESNIDRRRGIIFVYYNQKANIKYEYLKLQEKVNQVQIEFGQDFFAAVWKVDSEQLSNMFMSLQARGTGSLDQIREVIDKKVTRDLENIDGVSNVEIYGGKQRSVEVLLDDQTLKAYNLTPNQVSSAISKESSNRQFLGQVTEGNRQYFVNLISGYSSLSNIENVIIKPDGPLYLKDIAEIVEGGSDETSISRINGMESISITLIRDQQSNLLSLSHETRDIIKSLNEKIASDGVELIIQNDAAEIIEDNIDTIKMLALIGGILAIIILWIFLKNLPMVLTVAASIPISILISMNFFYAFDISINTLTLVGIAIAIGMLLDNSIVVLENIHRKLALGKSKYDSVVDGTSEVIRAVSASTLTTVCVFLPFVFSENFLIQTMGRHVGVSIISTLLVSLVVAFLLIPVFAYRFLLSSSGANVHNFNIISQKNRLQQIYTLLLKSCLRFPARTVLLGITAFFVSIIISLALSINISEEVETETFQMYATMPSGTTLKSSDEQVILMDERLLEIAELDDRTANIQEDNIVFSFKLKEDYDEIDKRDLPEIKDDILEKLNNGFPRVDFSYEQPATNSRFRGRAGGGFGGRAFQRLLGIGESEEKVVIKGSNLAVLRNIADDIEFNIGNLVTIRSVDVSVSDQQPGIDLIIDKLVMGYYNVSNNALISELGSFQNESSTGVNLIQGSDKISIILKNDDLEEKDSDDLKELQIPSNSGGTVPLTQLASLVYNTGYSNINRVNQEKQVEVIYKFVADVNESKELLDNARLEVDQIAATITPPAGVAIEVVHDETDYSEFYFLIAASIVLIFMILASVFESLITPLVMMFTIPLATIGAFWGLILTGNSILNANALIGLLILLGVVVNNGIIYIDYSRFLRKKGYRPSRALIAAGQARVRPILITAITTVLAMLPLAMGKAEYVAQIGAPFAITVIGGLSFGTLFTLILVPTVSFGMNNALKWWHDLSWKLKVLQGLGFLGGTILIYFNVEAVLWQFVNVTALLSIIPSLVYFVQVSLRRSRSDIIPANSPIKINIRNLVKKYDDFSRFTREWNKAERQKQSKFGKVKDAETDSASNIYWHLPLYFFHYYFVFIYLEGNFWNILLSVSFFIYSLKIISMIRVQISKLSKKYLNKLMSIVNILFFWFFPLGFLIWHNMRTENLTVTILLSLLWYPAILIYHGSKKLYREKIDINRLKGRFKWIRKNFYRLVKTIPIIGKKKIPFSALNQVSLEIGNGMYGLIGPNGAGKTTLMRVICGVLEQSRGKITINDMDINEYREELQALIGYLPQEFGTYENMTAYEFLDYQALLKGNTDSVKRAEIVNKAIQSVHLMENQNNKIKTFSGGMKQRVGIAQTLLHLPRILVVDEPTAGLDPKERIRFRNLLSELSRNRIVIFSTHIIEDISSSCNKLAVLDDGKVKFTGSPQEMVELAKGVVWQMKVSEEKFEELRSKYRVVHHISEHNEIRVRLISNIKPSDDAIPVNPSLEDSYLWLLDQKEADHA